MLAKFRIKISKKKKSPSETNRKFPVDQMCLNDVMNHIPNWKNIKTGFGWFKWIQNYSCEWWIFIDYKVWKLEALHIEIAWKLHHIISFHTYLLTFLFLFSCLAISEILKSFYFLLVKGLRVIRNGYQCFMNNSSFPFHLTFIIWSVGIKCLHDSR